MISNKKSFHSYNNSTNNNTLPSPPTNYQHSVVTMTRDQQKYCGAIIRNLKRHRDAAPFLKPVDYVKLNVPDYPSIVQHPIDLSIVDTKLNAEKYNSVEEFVADVRLIFNNCFKYNGPEAMISVLCQNVESAFEKSLRQMPLGNTKVDSTPPLTIGKEPSPPLSQHNSPPPQDYNKPELVLDNRPKREIHCPSKDYPETFTTPQRKLSTANKTMQMKFCFSVLREFKKTKYRNTIYPFLFPVDPVALNIPDYFTIVKQPMDLQTIETKLLNDDYKCPDEFKQDVLLMFDNCYLYNPPALPIYAMAQEMEQVFRDKWEQRPKEVEKKKEVVDEEEVFNYSKKKPSSRQVKRKSSVKVEEDEDDNNDSDSDDKIAELERSVQNIRQQIESMKHIKKNNANTVKKRPSPTTSKTPVKRKRIVKKKKVEVESSDEEEDSDNEAFINGEYTFKQKMKLSDRINNLNADELSGVVEIIQSSMPHLKGNNDNEIELEMESLDTATLYKLHNYIFPHHQIKQEKKSTYTKKQKRAHYNEKAANKKIHELEETLKKFEAKNSEDSSSSSSEDDDEDDSSSGSDSE